MAIFIGISAIASLGLWIYEYRSPRAAEYCHSNNRIPAYRVIIAHADNAASAAEATISSTFIAPKPLASPVKAIVHSFGSSKGVPIELGTNGFSEFDYVTPTLELGSPPQIQRNRPSEKIFEHHKPYLFPIDSFHAEISLGMRIIQSDGVEQEAVPDILCIWTKASEQGRIMPLKRSDTFAITITRKVWYIALVACACFIVWVPLVAVWNRDPEISSSLELITLISTTAAMRTFLTGNAEPYTYATLDVCLFLPFLLFATKLLWRTKKRAAGG